MQEPFTPLRGSRNDTGSKSPHTREALPLQWRENIIQIKTVQKCLFNFGIGRMEGARFHLLHVFKCKIEIPISTDVLGARRLTTTSKHNTGIEPGLPGWRLDILTTGPKRILSQDWCETIQTRHHSKITSANKTSPPNLIAREEVWCEWWRTRIY